MVLALGILTPGAGEIILVTNPVRFLGLAGFRFPPGPPRPPRALGMPAELLPPPPILDPPLLKIPPLLETLGLFLAPIPGVPTI